jgi:hypothetical protein
MIATGEATTLIVVVKRFARRAILAPIVGRLSRRKALHDTEDPFFEVVVVGQ